MYSLGPGYGDAARPRNEKSESNSKEGGEGEAWVSWTRWGGDGGDEGGGRREWKTVRRREKETADDRGVLTFDSCVFLTPIPRSFLLPLPPESGIRRRFIADRRIFRSTGCGPVDFSVTVLLYNFRALSLIYFVSYICRF